MRQAGQRARPRRAGRLAHDFVIYFVFGKSQIKHKATILKTCRPRKHLLETYIQTKVREACGQKRSSTNIPSQRDKQKRH